MVFQLVVRSAESRLVQSANEIHDQPANWQAIYFHLSQLLEEYKSEYQFKIAINLIHDLLKNHEGSLFTLLDNSIIIFCYKLEKLLLEKLIFQLRYLYMDDPLCYNEQGEENPNFCSTYDFKHDWKAIEALGFKYMSILTRKQSQGVKSESDPGLEIDGIASKSSAPTIPKLMSKLMAEAPPVIAPAPLITSQPDARTIQDFDPHAPGPSPDAKRLLTIEQMIKALNMRTVIRKQPVCALLADMKVRRVFDELYVNIAHMRKLFKSETEFLSNRWLFKYMTTLLDQRMIELIRTTPSHYLASPISINLNVETILSSKFNEFDASIKPEAKVSIVIELPVVDLFADMGAFAAALTEAHRLGYRVCLDGLSTESFLHIDRAKLGLDLVKVQWNADKQADLKSSANAALIEAVKTTGSNRIILCRCDNRSALEYGIALGISLFQGRYLDTMLNPTAKFEN